MAGAVQAAGANRSTTPHRGNTPPTPQLRAANTPDMGLKRDAGKAGEGGIA